MRRPFVGFAAGTEKIAILDSSCAPDWSGSILMSVKRLLLEKAVEAYSVFTPAKRLVLEIEDVNTIGS